MNEFDYEVLQRKRIAQQARRKRSGSKSKKCPLSSDNLTQKEWRERNGEVMTYNLRNPMKWAEFKYMPKDLQQQYITKLRDAFGATGKAVAEMLGVTPGAFTAYLKYHNINVFHRNGGVQHGKEWQAFIAGMAVLPEETPEPETQETTDDYLSSVRERNAEVHRAYALGDWGGKPTMSFDSFTLNFSGPFDREALCNSLTAMLQNGQRVKLTITCEMEGD